MFIKNLFVFFYLVLFIIISFCSTCKTDDVENLIIQKERQILTEWGKGHTMIFPDNSADEITYFDPSLQKRLNGKKEFIKLLKPVENKFTIERFEMIDPEVQVHGDVAVLTYNLIDYSKNLQGIEQKFLWNSTEVYKKIDGEWLIIHSHWSFTKPELKQ